MFFAYSGISVVNSNITTSNAADIIKLKVPKKKDSLASPFIVFAPDTENTMPTNDKDKLAIYSHFIKSTASTPLRKLSVGKKNTSVAYSAATNPTQVMTKPKTSTVLRAAIFEYG